MYETPDGGRYVDGIYYSSNGGLSYAADLEYAMLEDGYPVEQVSDIMEEVIDRAIELLEGDDMEVNVTGDGYIEVTASASFDMDDAEPALAKAYKTVGSDTSRLSQALVDWVHRQLRNYF